MWPNVILVKTWNHTCEQGRKTAEPLWKTVKHNSWQNNAPPSRCPHAGPWLLCKVLLTFLWLWQNTRQKHLKGGSGSWSEVYSPLRQRSHVYGDMKKLFILHPQSGSRGWWLLLPSLGPHHGMVPSTLREHLLCQLNLFGKTLSGMCRGASSRWFLGSVKLTMKVAHSKEIQPMQFSGQETLSWLLLMALYNDKNP